MTPRVGTFNYTSENRATAPLKDICSYAHMYFAKNNEKLWELENRSILIYGNRCDMAHETALVMNLMAIRASVRELKPFQHCKKH